MKKRLGATHHHTQKVRAKHPGHGAHSHPQRGVFVKKNTAASTHARVEGAEGGRRCASPLAKPINAPPFLAR